jgi:GT2 family glycosyltransferase
MSEALVSVLVLNYNGKKFLDDCFNSLLASSYSHFECIMIDNKSTDDSVAYTEKNYPQVRVFQNGINGGFSLAYNNAFKIAKGKYFVILNNDVRVEPDWLEPLVEAAEKDPQIGALQPKLLSMTEPHKFEYAGASGGFLDRYGYPFTRGRVLESMEEDKGQYNDMVRLFWTSGAAMFVRAETLSISGNLDEDFVHHMEEIDLCYRINLVGYTLKVIPESVVYHYGGGIISYESYKKMYWNHRNSVLMMLKNLERKNLFRFILVRFLLDTMTLGFSLLKLDFRRFRALIHAYLWLLFHPGMILRKRKEVRNIRKIRDKEIFSIMHKKSIAIQYFFCGKKSYKELSQSHKNSQ